MNKYIKLETEEKLPEELERVIDEYIAYLETGDKMVEDCYQMEIWTEINYCFREGILKDDTIKRLKDYYVKGGIHKEQYNNF